jgi:quercetin dioxygenase-like cupin family protein
LALLATGPKTGGALCLFDEVVGAEAGGPVTHTHPQDDRLYLIGGRWTFFAGGQTVSAGPGTFVAVPRNAEHAFMAEPGAHFINFYLPAGFELTVAGLDAPAERNELPLPDQFAAPPRALVDKLAADYGQTSVHGTPFVDPPLLENMAPALPNARAQPFAAHADAARSYWSNDILWSVLVYGAAIDSSHTLLEQLCLAGSGAPPHAHLFADEAFYMLEDEAEFVTGNVREVARAGALVFIPKGCRAHVQGLKRKRQDAQPLHAARL